MNLKQLYLHNIGLSTVPKEVFRQSNNLENLILSRNCLKSLPEFPPSLKLLNLNHNCLERISNDPFQNVYKLRVLLIEHNIGLKHLEEGSFSNASSLTILSLKGSKALEYLPRDFFNHTETLKMVSLAECNFKTVPPHFKKAMEKMAVIELYGNPWICNSSIRWFPWLNTPVMQDSDLR
jgi:Leucine-rich repeat (LRR) protein